MGSSLSYDMMSLKGLFLTPQRGQYLSTSSFQTHNHFPKIRQPSGKTGGAPRGQGQPGREGLHPWWLCLHPKGRVGNAKALGSWAPAQKSSIPSHPGTVTASDPISDLQLRARRGALCEQTFRDQSWSRCQSHLFSAESLMAIVLWPQIIAPTSLGASAQE